MNEYSTKLYSNEKFVIISREDSAAFSVLKYCANLLALIDDLLWCFKSDYNWRCCTHRPSYHHHLRRHNYTEFLRRDDEIRRTGMFPSAEACGSQQEDPKPTPTPPVIEEVSTGIHLFEVHFASVGVSLGLIVALLLSFVAVGWIVLRCRTRCKRFWFSKVASKQGSKRPSRLVELSGSHREWSDPRGQQMLELFHEWLDSRLARLDVPPGILEDIPRDAAVCPAAVPAHSGNPSPAGGLADSGPRPSQIRPSERLESRSDASDLQSSEGDRSWQRVADGVEREEA